jgi:type IV fimbrial biogenesis protein FimT
MSTPRGFTLVELMIAVAILGVLLSLGIPAFSTYLENARIRSTAGAFLSAAEVAKATAASQNVRVELILTDATDPGSLATAEGGVSATGAPTGWMVRTFDRAAYIEGKSAAEGGRGTVAVVNVIRTVAGVTFTPLGGTTLAAAAVFSFTNPTGGDCIAAGGPMRCLNVVVAPTGRIKLCDPTIAGTDTRACPT